MQANLNLIEKKKLYLIKRRNAICDRETDIEYDNTKEVDNTIIEYKDINNKMIKFLNAHPLFTFKLFKKYVNKYLEKKYY